MKKSKYFVNVWTTFENSGRPNTFVGRMPHKEFMKLWLEDSSINYGETYIDSAGFTQWK